jgi:3-dehydroquinate dehydratase-2
MKVIIINGPNLNLLGKREPEIYGNKSFDMYFDELKHRFKDIELSYFQSNVEGELINKIHEVGFSYDAIILNAGGYTHTSVALADAVAGVATPCIEVHISNIFAREEYRHVSLLSKHCIGIISGLGLSGYEMALQYLIKSGRK